MIERIGEFLPQILALLGIVVLTLAYLLAIMPKLSSFAVWEWRGRDKIKVLLMRVVPLNIIWAPAVEEAIFRLPLILLFSQLTLGAWLGIVASAAIFSSAHIERGKFALFAAFTTGLLAGYFGVLYQSVFASFVAHAIWNSFGVIFFSATLFLRPERLNGKTLSVYMS